MVILRCTRRRYPLHYRRRPCEYQKGRLIILNRHRHIRIRIIKSTPRCVQTQRHRIIHRIRILSRRQLDDLGSLPVPCRKRQRRRLLPLCRRLTGYIRDRVNRQIRGSIPAHRDRHIRTRCRRQGYTQICRTSLRHLYRARRNCQRYRLIILYRDVSRRRHARKSTRLTLNRIARRQRQRDRLICRIIILARRQYHRLRRIPVCCRKRQR